MHTQTTAPSCAPFVLDTHLSVTERRAVYAHPQSADETEHFSAAHGLYQKIRRVPGRAEQALASVAVLFVAAVLSRLPSLHYSRGLSEAYTLYIGAHRLYIG